MRKLVSINALLLTWLVVGYLPAQPGSVSPSADPELRDELLKRVADDQNIRKQLISKGIEQPDQQLLARMKEIDTANEERITAIVRQYGWPSSQLVGRDGAEAAFLLVQHAGLTLQKKVLPLVEKAYRSGDLSGQSYALLCDRVLVREGKPQVYGTQAKRIEEWKGREPVAEPIADEANVDKRRAKLGLPPLSEYLQMMKQIYFPENGPQPK